MYSGSGFQDSELGDVAIVKEGGLYHLFHLILPNHDYIAHAVSNDGFLWRRVNNALFIGDPGQWDDDMLWTMHVSKDPDVEGRWRMFYTGIARIEGGKIQRIGLAYSNDLYSWKKSEENTYPLAIDSPYYEESLSEGRHWLSCRDPFFFCEDAKRLLLLSARVPYGPVIRRGCVALAQEVKPDHFQWLPPIFFPRMYDDIEVPSLYKMKERYYLIGNIREDIKVHYWHCDQIFGEYESYANNVLLPRGNYAARLSPDDEGFLVWNFFYSEVQEEGFRLLPPPKSLLVMPGGQLELRSFSGFDQKVLRSWEQKDLKPMQRVLKNPTARSFMQGQEIELFADSAYEIFFFNKKIRDFRLRFHLIMEGRGKMGIIFRSDVNANAYFASLDLINGFAQLRSWRESQNKGTSAFDYKSLQENNFPINAELTFQVELICFGGYIELSIDQRVILSLVDTAMMKDDYLGLYLESAHITLKELSLEELNGPQTENYGPL